MEEKLKLLVKKTQEIQSIGFVRKYPNDLKNEAVYLLKRYSERELAKHLNVAISTVFLWKKTCRLKPHEEKINPPDIHVTHFSASKNHIDLPAIASIKKRDLEIKIFCPLFANNLFKEILS